MGKVNKELRSKLQFNKSEAAGEGLDGKQVIISTTHEGIYRQYSYHDDGTNDEEDQMLIDIEAKNILTHSIEQALIAKEKFMRGDTLTDKEIRIIKGLSL